MTVTPWGRTGELRGRQLRPGPSQSREEARRNQRERLMAAMVAVVAERGYTATRVADVLEVAGVSRNTFYALYDNKLDCFVGTLDAANELAVPAVVDVYDRTDGSWDERLGAMLDRLARVIVRQPAMARAHWVEVHAAGPEALDAVDRLDERIEAVMQSALAHSPERAQIPRDCVRAINRGLRQVIHTRVRDGRLDELPELMPQLLDWILSYRSPTERLRRPRKVPAGLVPEPAGAADSRERILTAVTELVGELGLARTAITDVARRAGVSLTTFYAHFKDKRTAFLAAVRRARERTLAVAVPAYRAGADWPRAVANALHAVVGLYTLDTALGRLGTIAAYEGGQAALESRDHGLAASKAYLADGHALNPDLPAVCDEAIGAAIYALLSTVSRERGPERLYETAPTAVFVALAPFVGSAEATRIANAPVRLLTARAA